MIQRYGHINALGPKIQRTYAKKGHPEGVCVSDMHVRCCHV